MGPGRERRDWALGIYFEFHIFVSFILKPQNQDVVMALSVGLTQPGATSQLPTTIFLPHTLGTGEEGNRVGL